jgi:mRNA interferase HigB
MHIITKSRLVEFWEKHPNSKTSLLLWYKITITANWQSFVEVRNIFSAADKVENFVVFNIGGNKYRLIAFIDYTYQKVFVRCILTHSEYDKNAWKDHKWDE